MHGHAPLRAVLFDMDETLIHHTLNFREVSDRAVEALAGRLGAVTPAQFWEAFWPRAVDLWFMMFDGVLGGAIAQRYAYVNALRALKANEALADELLEEAERVLVASTQLADDALEVLRTLRAHGLRLGLVTNGFSRTQRRKIQRHGLEAHLDFVLVSEEFGAHKPDPRIFHEALRRAGVLPEQALFVGDMPENDVKGALGVGMPAALLDCDGKREDLRRREGMPQATYAIRSLAELIPIVLPE